MFFSLRIWFDVLSNLVIRGFRCLLTLLHSTVNIPIHLKLMTSTWSLQQKEVCDCNSATETSIIANLRLWQTGPTPLRWTRNSPSIFSKPRHLISDRHAKAGDRIRDDDQAKEWCGHCKVHGNHHQHIILKRGGTEAYDRTRNAPHRTDKYPPPHRRLGATSARVRQQKIDVLPRIENDKFADAKKLLQMHKETTSEVVRPYA